MNGINNSEAQFLLRKILTLEATDLALNHLWIWETDRWKELVFALILRVASLPESQVRQLADQMNDLGLLNIPGLAEIGKNLKNPDLNNNHARHILEFLEENDFSPEEARGGLTVICEAARGMEEHFDSKVQRYLRSYGELILQDLSRIFQFSVLNDTEVKYVFTYWLQNVLSMPLSLLDENIAAFCKQHDLTPEQFIAAADELDVNLAVADDLIHSYLTREKIHKKADQSRK